MKKNMGNTDRIIRVVIAMIVTALIFSGMLSGIWAIVLGVIAGIFVLTSVFSFCPLYTIFGLSSCPVKK